MNKQGQTKGFLWFVGIVLVVLVASVVYYVTQPGKELEVKLTQGGGVATTTTTGGQVVTTPTGAGFSCPSSLKSDLKWRYLDDYSRSKGTVSYLGSADMYLIPQGTDQGGMIAVTNSTSSSTGTYTTDTELLKCDTAKVNKWTAVALTHHRQQTSSVTELVNDQKVTPAEVEIKGANDELTMVGAAISELQYKFKGSDGIHYLNESFCSGGAGTTSWYYFNTSSGGTNCKLADPAGYSELNVNANDFYETTMYLKANETLKNFGENGLKVWLCNDAAPTYWKKPTVHLVNGADLTERKGQAPPQLQSKLSDYEYCFVIMDTTGAVEPNALKTPFNENEVMYYIRQDSTTSDPGASQDPNWRICAEGRYKSTQLQDTILIDCFDDSTNQNELATDNKQAFTIDVT